MIKITKEMIIGDILNEAPDMAPVLMAAGIRRRGCLCSWYRAGAAHHQSKCFR